MVNQVRKGQQALQEREDYPVCQVCQVPRDTGDSLALMVQRALLEQLVKRVKRVLQDHWVHLVQWVPQVHVGREAVKDLLDHQD